MTDTSLEHLLEVCQRRLLTGRIELSTPHGPGEIELRAGMINHARLSGCADDVALERLLELDDGVYMVVQRLPDLSSTELAGAAELRGDLEAMSLVQVMRYCEEHALTVTITIINDFDRAELSYQAGEILRVTFNGVADEERITDIMRFENARFRVSSPPLRLDYGKPVMRRAPTAPLTISHLRECHEPVSDDEQLEPAPTDYKYEPDPPVEPVSWLTRVRRRVAHTLHALGTWIESDRFDTATERWRRAVRR